jgi:O-antigen/teichoic acid export membrane protein
MVETPPQPSVPVRAAVARGLTRDGTQWLLTGSVLGGLGAYLFQVVGTRALGEEAYAPISTLWTIQYLCWSIFLFAVETYVTRESVAGRLRRGVPRGTTLRLWTWIAAVAAAVAGASWVAADFLFYGLHDLAVVAGLTVLSFGGFAIVRGRLAGVGRFRSYGLVSATESMLRLAVAISIVLVAATTRSLAWALPVGAAGAALLWFPLRNRRPDAGADAPLSTEPPRTSRFLILTTSANGASQVLLAGGPLLLAALAASPREVSIFFVTTTAARVPVVLALGGVLSRVLPTFSRILEERGDRARVWLAARLVPGTVVLAVAGAAGGWVLGPTLIGFLFGAGFAPPPWLGAVAGAGVLLATGGMILNQLLVAAGLERRLPAPWIAGLVAGIAVVAALSGSPTVRVGTGFIVGEAVALVCLATAVVLRRAGATGPATR